MDPAEGDKKHAFPAGRARKRKELNVWFYTRCVLPTSGPRQATNLLRTSNCITHDDLGGTSGRRQAARRLQLTNGFTNDKMSRTSGRRHAARRLRTAIGFRNGGFCGRLVADRRPDVFELLNALQMMIRGGRLVVDRRPDAFERQMALQIKLRGTSGRRPAARRLRMANGFTNNNVRGPDGN